MSDANRHKICAESRDKSKNPAEYCFGVSQERHCNIFGCSRADANWAWNDSKDWLRCGRFDETGAYIFSKDKIRTAILDKLTIFSNCPHLHINLIDAVLEELPESVKVPDNKDWEFIKRHEDEPGAISVIERERDEYGDVIFEDEYRAVGVKPKSFSVGSKILRRALEKCEITNVDVGLIERAVR